MDWLLPFLPGFGAAYAILLVGAASPGPAVAMLLGLGVSQGRTSAITASFGIACGSASLALATTQGLALIMEQVAWLATAIKIAGVAYLLWLAFKAWGKALTPPRIAVAQVDGLASFGRNFMTGYLLQVTNLKAVVFWLAISATGPTQGAPMVVLALFIVGAFAISLILHGTYAILLSSSPFRRAYNHARRWIEAGLGAFLTYVAFRLATERS